MNNNLIAVKESSIAGQKVNTVNGRDLYTFLEIKKDFSSWVKRQVKRGRFIDGRDFTKLTQKGELSKTGQKRIEYYFTLDAGKHIGMMSNTDKGFQIRDYFLDCEKKVKQVFQVPQNFPEALQLAADQAKEISLLSEEKEQNAPKVRCFDRIAATTGKINITSAAKILNVGPKTLFTWLETNKYIYRRAGAREWVGYQNKVHQGILTHKPYSFFNKEGEEVTRERVLVTSRGITHLAAIFSELPQQHITGNKKTKSKQMSFN